MVVTGPNLKMTARFFFFLRKSHLDKMEVPRQGKIFANLDNKHPRANDSDEEIDEMISQLEESTQKLNKKINMSKSRLEKDQPSKPKASKAGASKESTRVTGTNISLYAKAIGSETLQKWHQKISNVGKIAELLESGGEKDAIEILEKMNRRVERIPLTLLEFAAENAYNAFLEKVFELRLQVSPTDVKNEKKVLKSLPTSKSSPDIKGEKSLKSSSLPSPSQDNKCVDPKCPCNELRKRNEMKPGNKFDLIKLAEEGNFIAFEFLCQNDVHFDQSYFEGLISKNAVDPEGRMQILAFANELHLFTPTMKILCFLLEEDYSMFYTVALNTNSEDVLEDVLDAIILDGCLLNLRWYVSVRHSLSLAITSENDDMKDYLSAYRSADWHRVNTNSWFELIPLMIKKHGRPTPNQLASIPLSDAMKTVFQMS